MTLPVTKVPIEVGVRNGFLQAFGFGLENFRGVVINNAGIEKPPAIQSASD
jgi:hypothetical protein